MKRPLVTLTTIVKDGEPLLPEMIVSARPVVDEFVLVIDSSTKDDTAEVARKLGARVLRFDWVDDFGKARNIGLDAAKGDWILVLDADDRLLPYGVTWVRKWVQWGTAKLREFGIHGYRMLIEERDLAGNVHDYQYSSGRLFPNRKSLRYLGRTHEEIVYMPDPTVEVRWGEVPQDMRMVVDGKPHYPRPLMAHVGYDPSLLPAKWARNDRLLRLRCEEEPTNPWPRWYMARQKTAEGKPNEAADWARDALRLDGGRFKREHRVGMEQIIAAAGVKV